MKRKLSLLTQVIIILVVFAISSCNKYNKSSFSYTLIPIEKENKWGYIDHEGKWIINPQFDDAYLFSEGLALVRNSDDKYGYINDKGHYVINAQYVNATHFSESYAIVVSENGYPTCIDKSGKVKFVLKQADEAHNFQEGLACVKVGLKYGYVNKEGEMVITPQFDFASRFSEGYAVYGVRDDHDSTKRIFGFIDKKGKVVVNAQFKYLSILNNGTAAASSDEEKYGYVDAKGKYVVNPQFDDAKLFNEGLAAVKQGESWGYIDESGTFMINPQFERAGEFSEGVAAIQLGKENWGFIDKKGKIVINPQFKAAESFYDGIALVTSGTQIGLITKDGKYAANPQFDGALGYFLNTFYPEVAATNSSTVESDYFDGENLSKIIIGDMVNCTGIRGVNSQTTYSALKPFLSPTTKPSPYTSELSDKKSESISEGISVTSINYGFEDNLQEYTSGFFTTNYDYVSGGYLTKLDNRLKSIQVNIELDSWGKTRNKAVKLANAIKSNLITSCNVSESGNERNSTKYSRDVIAGVMKGLNEDKDRSAVFLFGEKCQYLVLTEKKSNTIQLYALFSEAKDYKPKGDNSSYSNSDYSEPIDETYE